MGFRNYWFRPIKTVIDSKKLARMYKTVQGGK